MAAPMGTGAEAEAAALGLSQELAGQGITSVFPQAKPSLATFVPLSFKCINTLLLRSLPRIKELTPIKFYRFLHPVLRGGPAKLCGQP